MDEESAISSSLFGQFSHSDDSGCIVHTTSSSLSDSSRILKNGELLESDGEVSQFDSLDNSEEGGMSAENFNTLKKGPLVVPIDPPPEFQDSPQTTLLRTRGYHDFAQLLIKDILGEAFLSILQHRPSRAEASESDEEEEEEDQVKCFFSTVLKRKRISVSDPQLNVTTSFLVTTTTTINPPSVVENIYDDPSGDSTRNSDDIEVDYYISKQVTASLARKKSSTLSANSQLLLRPNSRNSSRLSSSHNSLATTGASNKVDDTTFITQAMSHDPLMIDSGQSILDFYNVPLDSDIYALPVDVVSPDEEEATMTPNQIGRRGRRFRFPSSVSNNPGGGSSSSRLSITGLSKSSEAKRRLFRKAQNGASSRLTTKAASALASFGAGGGGGVTMTSVVNSSQVNAKRFSAPDGLGIVESVNGGGGGGRMGKQKRRVKREKRSSSSGNTHPQQQLPVVVPVGHKIATSDSSDEGGEGEAITVNGGGSGSGSGQMEERRRESAAAVVKAKKEKEPRKPLTIITVSKTLKTNGNSSSNCSGGGGGGQKEKKTTIPISTSFTSQSSMQSNCQATPSAGGGGGGVGEGSSSSGKTTKREARDATKRGHNQFSTNLKQKFCSIFRFRNNKSSSQLALTDYGYADNYIAAAGQKKSASGEGSATDRNHNNNNNSTTTTAGRPSAATIMLRALPPLPRRAPANEPPESANRRRPPAELPATAAAVVEIDSNNNDVLVGGASGSDSESAPPTAGRVDFASNLETIKQYGWYWGPISCQAAEKILSNEPDGSFIVRDSSDDHYIFSLTFKLNNCVRHVRIEQDKGTFSFGQLAKFKARTIVEFIEQALEYSRSGRYLFFLHRRPEHGPMRVQLKNPVSRFKHIQSLQHMCRFVIMKAIVRKDLIPSLPLPNRLKDYLSYKNCYTEHFVDDVAVGEEANGRRSTTAVTTTAEQEENGEGNLEVVGQGN